MMYPNRPRSELPRTPVLGSSVNKGEITLSALTIHREFIENSSLQITVGLVRAQTRPSSDRRGAHMVQTLSIRTKLIRAMLALVASVALMGMTADDAKAAGVTEIRWVENHTPYPAYLWNHETKAVYQIFPHTAVSVNQRIPWARNPDEFKEGHYIEIGWLGIFRPGDPCTLGKCAQLAIWQESHNTPPNPGDLVRYTRGP